MTTESGSVFEGISTFPDPAAARTLASLVGMEAIQESLSKTIRASLNPSGLEAWLQKHHSGANALLESVLTRPQLFILAGDVGTGKTTVAENIGDAVARAEGIRITLHKLSLNARGSGMVGEMTKLISNAFQELASEAKKLKGAKAKGGIIFVIDEGDSLAQSREMAQMHHEDRAGVNALIRGIDLFSKDKLPIATILCTNRLGAIDPAVRRRAADVFEFKRPTNEQRMKFFKDIFGACGIGDADLKQIVDLTGENGKGHGFTYSDLRQRLVPAVVLDAYPDKKVEFSRMLKIVKDMVPTPPFDERRK